MNMKRIISVVVTVIAASLTPFSLNGQIDMGIIGGISTADIPSGKILIDKHGLDTLSVFASDARYGIHFGVFVRAQLLGVYIEPSIIFNSNSIDYAVQDLKDDHIFTELRKESYQQLTIPIIFGIKTGIFRIGTGPVGHIFIDSSSELLQISGYQQRFDDLQWGWQGLLGLDLWKLRFDLRYEGKFSKHGGHFEFFGDKYQFSSNPNRLIASVGLTF